ncbi:Uu.00g022750.m01.CDS01 [Anthostomella pinea]|uniref:Uu.00g022750.m01.CDS01 n=1 Tax=Anthostomella pinea TaxID=933095 RepID=A0AAI8VU23_9PEZI|nr:Uu.00g022750.m01.CDS01 [Anthostomella pinea]
MAAVSPSPTSLAPPSLHHDHDHDHVDGHGHNHELHQPPPSHTNTSNTAAARANPSSNATTATTAASKPPSSSRTQKPAGFLAYAAAAFDKTVANRSEPTAVRIRHSSSTLRRLSLALESPTTTEPSSSNRSSNIRTLSSNSTTPSTRVLPSPLSQTRRSSEASLKDIISKPYSETDASRPPPTLVSNVKNKMHQTSSRLLRMTDDDRPFTRDFKDLFSTLIVSLLPLSPHRVRLTRIEHTFLSEDAINNLGSLKFSQSNRMPDPKDPSRIVTTTTTTTFSMAKDMARSICQRFLDARFIESADGKLQQVYTMKGAVWQLTPKGVCVLDRFCSRNGIQQRQIADLISLGTSHMCILERDPASDKLVMDRGTMEVLFRRLLGANGLNVKSSVSSADSDSLSDYRDGLTGVKMASERKVGGKTYKDTFTGKAVSDWLMDCCTTVDRRETYELSSLFVEYELMEAIQADRGYMASSPSAAMFQPTKNAIYQLTSRGKEIFSGGGVRGRTSESEGLGASSRPGVARDSNTQRLDKILNDAALRLLFRENLRETHCEENLSFYLDVDEFVRGCRVAIKLAQKNPNSTSMDGIKEIMAQAYGIYNAFLAPGSPCELNIDHQLRNNLATRMTKAVGQDVAMIDTLHEVTTLFEDAQNAVFKLMASDSVPKFLRNNKYEHTLKNYDFDAIVVGGGAGRMPERSQSRSNRK